jgi:hypothetical protein
LTATSDGRARRAEPPGQRAPGAGVDTRATASAMSATSGSSAAGASRTRSCSGKARRARAGPARPVSSPRGRARAGRRGLTARTAPCRAAIDDLAQLDAGGAAEGEHDGLRDLARVGEVRVGRRLVLVGPPVEEVRAHAAGDEQRDADAAGGLGRERAGEADDAELRRAVGVASLTP